MMNKTSIPTGLSTLDEAMGGGMKHGMLYVIAGHNSCGKSSMLRNIALNVATRGVRTMFFSLQSSPANAVHAMVLSKLRLHGPAEMLSAEGIEQFREGLRSLEKIPVVWGNECTRCPEDLVGGVEAEPERQLLVVDGISQVAFNADPETYSGRIHEAIKTLKSIAVELNIPVVASHRTHPYEAVYMERLPMLKDVQEHDLLDEYADFIASIHLHSRFRQLNNLPALPEPEKALLVVMKTLANGVTGTKKLLWDKRSTRWSDLNETEAQKAE